MTDLDQRMDRIESALWGDQDPEKLPQKGLLVEINKALQSIRHKLNAAGFIGATIALVATLVLLNIGEDIEENRHIACSALAQGEDISEISPRGLYANNSFEALQGECTEATGITPTLPCIASSMDAALKRGMDLSRPFVEDMRSIQAECVPTLTRTP
jgi:hypothetical protein